MSQWFNNSNPFSLVIAFIIIYNIICNLCDFFWDFVEDHQKNKYSPNLIQNSTKNYLQDMVISFVLNVLINTLLLSTLFLIVMNFANWWMLVPVLLIIFFIATNLILPIIRARFFDNLIPLSKYSQNLIDDIKNIIDSKDIKFDNIYINKTTNLSNSWQARSEGLLFRNKIILSENFIKHANKEETASVILHEIGHFYTKDILKLNLLQVLIFTLICWVLFPIVKNQYSTEFYGFENVSAHSIVFLIIIWWDVLKQLSSPIINSYSRRCEYRADAFSLRNLSNYPYAVSSALIKTHKHNQSVIWSVFHPLYAICLRKHPNLLERLKALNVGYNNKR